MRHPRETEAVCSELAARFRTAGVDVVVGPTTGGVILAFEVARQLGVAAAYAERRTEGRAGREFRRGTTFEPGQKILVVDDILTTGGSVRETLSALRSHAVEVVAVAVLVDRSAGAARFELPLIALARLDVAAWDPSDCPQCAAGIPLTKPGTASTPS